MKRQVTAPIAARVVGAVTLLGTFALGGCGATDAAGSDGPPVGDSLPQEVVGNIDPAVRARFASGAQPVILLARTQMLLGPDALVAFAAENEGGSRSALRSEVTERLREMAASEEDSLVALLPADTDHRRLWIVNAVAAVLDRDAIEAAAASPLVRYVYPADGLPPQHQVGSRLRQVSGGEDPPFDPSGKRVPWNLTEIGAERAWKELGVNGRGVVIAAFDTGVRYGHSDIRGRMWRNPGEVPNNGIDDDGNGWTDDLFGYDFSAGSPEIEVNGQEHGAFVSGILVGDGTGGMVLGVAPGARLMALRAGGDVSALLALQYALANGADVVNMSFSRPGLGSRRGLWRLAADHATAGGVVLVSGAGNFRQSEAIPVQMRVPEDIPSVIAAGGVDRNREVVMFSSGGPVDWSEVVFYGDHAYPPGLVKPDVAGFPGAGYPILDPAGGYTDPNNSRRGNSFSGPHASGVAALVLSANPELPAWRVKAILEETAVDLGPTGRDNDTGAGLLDAYAAVARALGR